MVRVAVIGCGGLGANVVGELAFHGHEVRVHDASNDALDRLQPRLAEDRKALREYGLLTQPAFVGAVFCMTRLQEALKGAELVIECISDDLGAKAELMEAVSRSCGPNCILGSSSLRLNIDAIFERASHPERCLGLRFLYPVYAIPEVELQLCAATSTATLSSVRAFLERMGKTCFLRAGPEPLVLTDGEREARRTRALQAAPRTRRPPIAPRCTLPDLANQDILCSTLTAELEALGGSASCSSGGLVALRERDCVVCMDEERNCVLHPCHHLCTCSQCGRMLLKRQDACPVCRRHISSIFRVFHS